MSITGKRKLPDMRIKCNDCGSAQHGAIVMVSFHDTSLFNSSAEKAAYQPKPSPREFFWRIVACITWKFSKRKCKLKPVTSKMDNYPRLNSRILQQICKYQQIRRKTDNSPQSNARILQLPEKSFTRRTHWIAKVFPAPELSKHPGRAFS